MPIVDRVLSIARRELGVHESGGNNRGPRVEEYQAAVGIGPDVGGDPQPWCAAMVAWVMRQAAVQGWPMTGDTWAIEDWGRTHGVLHETPARGDVFLLLGSNGRPIHTGFVTSVAGGRVGTLEGNTGGPSDTDGDGVYAKSRPVAACLYVRWADVGGNADPPPEHEIRYVKVFSHHGVHSMLIDGKQHEVTGIKVNGAPFPPGEILVAYRPEP